MKVKPSLAYELEASLDGATVDIRQSNAQNATTQGFLNRYALQEVTPLHPILIHLRRKHGWSETQLADHLRQSHGTRTIRAKRSATLPEISRTYVVDLPDSSPADRQALLKRLQTDPEIEFAEPDQVVTTCDLPNDPYLATTGTWGQTYADLWGHYAIKAPNAWTTTNGSGVVVAVIDTGLDATHPDIAANIWTNTHEVAGNGLDDDGDGYVDDVHGWDFVGASIANPTPSNDPVDHYGHGTHVSGTIAATGNNTVGIIGVAWGAKIMPLKALDDSGAGLESILVQAIRYAADNGADIINASWAGKGNSQAIAEAIQYAYGLGVVFVAAAGNNSDDALSYFPANAPEAITVAALSPGNGWVGFSNYGTKIDVAAPGVDVLSLCASGTALGPMVGTQYVRLDGTSMAAPHVAGTAALLLSQAPTLPVEDIRQMLRGSAVDMSGLGWSPHLGSGILNAQSALALRDPLQAHIMSPIGGSHLNAFTVIKGFAQGPGFDHYVLEYGSGMEPSIWIPLQTGSTPVSGGTLAAFDPSGLSDGLYSIRLWVFGAGGHVFSDRVLVNVDYVSITSPMVPMTPATTMVFKPGVAVPITGTATGASFHGYTILWAKGISPVTGWNSTGISLTGTGQLPVRDALLGRWDTTGIHAADYYTIRVQVQNSGFASHADTLVYLEPDLLSPNWPQVIDPGLGSTSGFTPVINPSGDTRLALVSAGSFFDWSVTGSLFRYSADGTLLSSSKLPWGTYANPSAGDLDDTPGQELVFSSAGDDLAIAHPDNTLSILKPLNGDRRAFDYNPAILEDLEGDSQLGLVVTGGLGTSDALDVFGSTRDGSTLKIDSRVSLPSHWWNMATWGTPQALIGDIYGDGKKEFIVVHAPSDTTFHLALYAMDGTALPWPATEYSGRMADMVLADLDQNGKLEVAMVDSNLTVHVYQPDGTERPGWPQSVGNGVNDSARLAVGDLDRNGTEEIVVVTQQRVFVFGTDGTIYSNQWPLTNQVDSAVYNSSFFGDGIALADVDGDGFQEVLVFRQWLAVVSNPMLPAAIESPLAGGNQEILPRLVTATSPNGRRGYRMENQPRSSYYDGNYYRESKLLAYGRDGTVSRSWTLFGAGGDQPTGPATITVGDANQDGQTDIAVTYALMAGGDISGWLMRSVGLVLNTGTPYVAAANDWPMTHHDPRNTATLSRIQSAKNFRLSASASSVVIALGQQSTLNLAITPINEFHDPVVLACSGLPNGVTYSLSSATVTPPGTVTTSTLTILDSVALQPGASFPITVTASSGGLVHTLTLTLTLNAADFTLTVDPAGATINPGGTRAFNCVLTPLDGFQGGVSLSCTGLPTGFQYAFTPASVVLNGSPVSCTLAITSPSTVPITNPTAFTVTASGGGISRSTNSSLMVTDFTLTVDPAEATINPGGTRTFNCVLAPLNGFQGGVSLSCTGLPAGFQFAFTPATVVLNGSPVSCTLAIASPSTVPITNPTAFTVTASGGGISRSTNSSLMVTDFSVTVAPTAPTLKAGGSTTATCSVTPISGFDGTVTLSCSGLPSDVQASFSPASVTPNGGPATSVVTLTASTSIAGMREGGGEHPFPSSHSFGGLIWLALRDDNKRSNLWRKSWFLGAAMFLLLVVQASCGGGSSSPPPSPASKTYTITILASAGALSHSENITLTVNP